MPGGRTALAALALLGAAVLALGLHGAPSAHAQGRPNVVVIQTDDQTLGQLRAVAPSPYGGTGPVMPNTLNLIGAAGADFRRYYVSDPLCCPSRATTLTGRYAHNNGVRGNGPGPGGGYMAFDRQNNLAVWLQNAGYRTIHLGKFLNLYGQQPYSDPRDVPPGWSDWETLVGEDSTHYFYGYTLNVNGNLVGPFGDLSYQTKDPAGCPDNAPQLELCNYQTDVLTRRAVQQIELSSEAPFFLSLDYIAPHGDFQPPDGPEPAPRHYNTLTSVPLPRPPGFNERDVSDKPYFIRRAPRLTGTEIQRATVEYQKELESLRAVDDGVGKIIDALQRTGQLDDTYVFFISDNGFFEGEHRLSRAKFLAYEPSTHLPLLLRGPGIPPGVKPGALVGNVDLAPTILQLTGAAASLPLDGTSVLPFAQNPALRSRRPLLLEAFTKAVDIGTARGGAQASIAAPPEDYHGILAGNYKYIRYSNGTVEAYDLGKDPYELHNFRGMPRYRRVLGFLGNTLRLLAHCAGPGCRPKLPKRLPRPLPRHSPAGHGHSG